jgi:hypothetical protein
MKLPNETPVFPFLNSKVSNYVNFFTLKSFILPWVYSLFLVQGKGEGIITVFLVFKDLNIGTQSKYMK